MKLKQLTEDIFYQDEFRGANTSIIKTSLGLVLIEVPPDIKNAKIWVKEIKKLGDIRFVINTEAHHDHWITNSMFGDQIIAHEKTRELMAIQDHKFIRDRTSLIYSEPFEFPDEFEIRLPNITFSKDMTLRLGNLTLQLINLPGHTEGQIAVYIPEEKVLFTGDTVVNRIRIPYHDSLIDDRWLDSLKILSNIDFKYLVPGHGEVMDATDGKIVIKEITGVVKGFLKAVKEGKTQGRRMSVEVNQSIDPYYNVLPRGQKPGGVLLFNSKESAESGKHGKLEGKKTIKSIT
jgi:cyclase